MNSTLRLSLACLLLGLAGCSLQPPAPDHGGSAGTPQQLPPPGQQNRPLLTPSQPLPPKVTRMKSHPRYAPPPGAACYWDTALGVYVLEGQQDLYYRERTYYRWNQGWSWSNSPTGPWQPTDSSGVPAGLGRRHP